MNRVPSNATEQHRQNRNARKTETMTQLVKLLHTQDVEDVSLSDSTNFATHPGCLGNMTIAQNNHGFKPLSAAASCPTFVTSKNVVAVCFLTGGLILSCLLASCIEARLDFDNSNNLQQQIFDDNQIYMDLKDQEYPSSNRFNVEDDVDNSVKANDKWELSEEEIQNDADVEKKSCVSDDGTDINWKMCSRTLPHTEVSNTTMQILVESRVLRFFPLWAIQDIQKHFPNLPVHKLGHPEDLESLTELTSQENKKLNNGHQRISHEKQHAKMTTEADFVVESENETEESALDTKGIELVRELEKPQKSLNVIEEVFEEDSSDWTKAKCIIWFELQKNIPHEASLMAIGDEVKNDCVSSLKEKLDDPSSLTEKVNHSMPTKKSSRVSNLVSRLMRKLRTNNSSQNRASLRAANLAAKTCDDPTAELQNEVKKSVGTKIMHGIKSGGKKFAERGKLLITRAMSSTLGQKFKPIFKRIAARVKRLLHFWVKHGDAITVILNIVSLIATFSVTSGGIGAIILLGLAVSGFVAHLSHTVVLHRQRRSTQRLLDEQLAIDIGDEALKELRREDDTNLHGRKKQLAQGRAGVQTLAKIKVFIRKFNISRSLRGLIKKLETMVLYLGTLFFKTLKAIFKPILSLLSPLVRISSAFNFFKFLTPPDKLSSTINGSVQSALLGTRTIFAIKAVVDGLTTPTSIVMPIISLCWIIYMMGNNLLNTRAINRMNDDVMSMGYNHCLHVSKEPDCVTKVVNAVKYIASQSRNDMSTKFAFEMMKLVKLKQESATLGSEGNAADLNARQQRIVNNLLKNEPDEARKNLLTIKLRHMGFLNENDMAPPQVTASSVPPRGFCIGQQILN